MLMKPEVCKEHLMRKPEQCDCLLLASSAAGNVLCGGADAAPGRRASGLAARLQERDDSALPQAELVNPILYHPARKDFLFRIGFDSFLYTIVSPCFIQNFMSCWQ